MIAITTNGKGGGFQKSLLQVFLTALGILGKRICFEQLSGSVTDNCVSSTAS
jgi:hypothetical protein